jgi:hypothetical protein
VIPEKKLLFSRQAAAEATDLSLRAIDYAVESGILEAVRVGKRVMIPRDSLITFCRRGCARIRPVANAHAGVDS